MKFNIDFLTILLVFMTTCNQFAQKRLPDNVSKLTKTNVLHHYSKFNINNISTFIYNDGDSDISLNNDSGFEYPKGSNKTVVYESGIVWGGIINGKIHVGGNTYNQGILPGKVLQDGSVQDPNGESVRVYRVRPDFHTSTLTSEFNDGEGEIGDIRSQYQKDWNEWPAEFAAPFEDIDKNGIYDPIIDVPGVPGAHQTLWYVANDFDTTQCRSLYGSDPMKLEIQVTIWGYGNTIPPYNDVMFRKYKLINKNNFDIDDMYISQFVDPDVGGR